MLQWRFRFRVRQTSPRSATAHLTVRTPPQCTRYLLSLWIPTLLLSRKQEAFKVRNFLHAGMLKKPLEPYSPNAHRSRLPSPTVIMPYKNSSSIMIGDRASENRRQFITSNTNSFNNPSLLNTSNGGIISEKTKWKKHLQDL